VTFRIEPQDGSFLINGALGLDYVTITYLRDARTATTRATIRRPPSGPRKR
jgi:hypothetical protein